MSIPAKPKKRVPAPDGLPKRRAAKRGETAKSRVSEVQDPLISGDERKRGKRLDTADATVDEAGQIRRTGKDVDLLH